MTSAAARLNRTDEKRLTASVADVVIARRDANSSEETSTRSELSIAQYHCTPRNWTVSDTLEKLKKAPEMTSELRANVPETGRMSDIDSSFLEDDCAETDMMVAELALSKAENTRKRTAIKAVERIDHRHDANTKTDSVP